MLQLIVNDLEEKSIGPCEIALCQIPCPSEFEVTEEYQFTEDFAQGQEQKILNYLNSLKESIRFVVFPEFSIPEQTLSEIKRVAKEKKIYVIGGLNYDYRLRNRCIVVTPMGKCYKSTKLTQSKYDHPKMRCGEYINCFINTGFGDFAVLICYDYTSQEIIQELNGKIDILFVVTNNPGVKTFSQKATSDCWTSYCFIVICNNAEYGGSGIYGPLQVRREKNRKKRILEVQKGERCENFEFDVSKLSRSIKEKTGLTLECGSKFMAIPANFERVKLSGSKPQLEYTLLDWPEPFDQDCIIIIGSATERAIHQLTGRKEDFERIKQIDENFFQKLKPYLPFYSKHYIAAPSDTVFLPQLTAKLLSSPKSKKPPIVYEDDWVIQDKQIHQVLCKHNIISIGTPEVNKISQIVNEELKKDGHIYFSEEWRPHTIFCESIGRELDARQKVDKAGIIGLTRNPFNRDKLALLCGGIHGPGTAAALKFLAENDGKVFKRHKYGQIVFVISLNRPSGFLKGPVDKVSTIDEIGM